MTRKRSFLHSLNNAVEGFIHVVRHERNMRLHFLFAFFVLLLAFFAGVARTDWLILCLAVSVLLMAEMINTAIEEMMDLLHGKYHPTVKLVKDISAGMVLVAAGNAFILSALIFSKYWTMPFGFVAMRLKHSTGSLLFLSLLVAVMLVVYAKAHGKKGSPFRGGIVSGHTAVAFSFWTVVLFVQDNLFVTAVVFLMAALVAQSRLRSKIHSFWEVVAGAAVGVVVTAFLFKIFL